MTPDQSDYIKQIEEANDSLKNTIENMDSEIREAKQYVPHWECTRITIDVRQHNQFSKHFPDTNCLSYSHIREFNGLILVFGKKNKLLRVPGRGKKYPMTQVNYDNIHYIPATIIEYREYIDKGPVKFDFFLFGNKGKKTFTEDEYEKSQKYVEKLFFGRKYIR